jgi:hypothetical protein
LQRTIIDPDSALLQYDKPIIYDIVFDPFDPQTPYAASSHGVIWRSEDGGQTWTQAAAGMDPNEPVYQVLPDPNRLVCCMPVRDCPVFVSTDSAQIWGPYVRWSDQHECAWVGALR